MLCMTDLKRPSLTAKIRSQETCCKIALDLKEKGARALSTNPPIRDDMNIYAFVFYFFLVSIIVQSLIRPLL